MTRQEFRAAISAAGFMLVAVAAFSAGGTRSAAAVECSGPLKQCAVEVGAFCEIENGKLMMWYKEREGAVMRFEECVGRVYEAHGRPNPYRPASSSPKPASQR
jgi:hypothetical protein